jgi:hypothetical protein
MDIGITIHIVKYCYCDLRDKLQDKVKVKVQASSPPREKNKYMGLFGTAPTPVLSSSQTRAAASCGTVYLPTFSKLRRNNGNSPYYPWASFTDLLLYDAKCLCLQNTWIRKPYCECSIHTLRYRIQDDESQEWKQIK